MITLKLTRKSDYSMMQTIDERIEILERDRKLYESYKGDAVNSHECIRAYHEWYSQAAVLFDELIPADDVEYVKFRAVNNELNGFELQHNYHTIFSSYSILLNRLKAGKYNGITTEEAVKSNMEKIYQIFISSTYEDLIMERQEVMAAVVSTGNVPVGMEYFPAGDASPFDYIKQQIDQVDYYILVLAGKYGTVNEAEGISYTEMEFNYAREKRIPIAVLLYKDIDNLTGKQLEKDPVKREKLETFRKACKNGRMADFWENRDQLKMKVKDAIRNLVNNSPRSGWIRATSDTLAYNANKVNKKMLDEEVELHYESSLRSFGLDLSLEPKPKKVSMANILGVLSSVLRVPSSEMAIDEALNARYSYLEKSTIDDIKRRLIRAGWVKVELVNIDGQGIGNAWTLTPQGFQIWANLPQN